MKPQTALDRFLLTDPQDVGCEQAMEILHVYVELVAADAAAEDRYPPTSKPVALAQRTSPGCWPPSKEATC
jgi:hypothetical protein